VESELDSYADAFRGILSSQLARARELALDSGEASSRKPLIVGLIPGDGIGPLIMHPAREILTLLLKNEVDSGEVILRDIDGLTLENRMESGEAIPSTVLNEVRQCSVLLKGPTTTPGALDSGVSLESANVALRRELDLYANIRPIRLIAEDVTWVFIRENTEGLYPLGSRGLNINGELAVDFRVTSLPGSLRINRLAFMFARKRGLESVTCVTKANILKATDGLFLKAARQISSGYPEITLREVYVDAMAAALLDANERGKHKVIVSPNLYGDILSDEAAQLQGGLGTAGSANIGDEYALFEAIHGSAPQMLTENRHAYANPASILRATAMMLGHIGYTDKANALNNAMDEIAMQPGQIPTGYPQGPTTKQYLEKLTEALGI